MSMHRRNASGNVDPNLCSIWSAHIPGVFPKYPRRIKVTCHRVSVLRRQPGSCSHLPSGSGQEHPLHGLTNYGPTVHIMVPSFTSPVGRFRRYSACIASKTQTSGSLTIILPVSSFACIIGRYILDLNYLLIARAVGNMRGCTAFCRARFLLRRWDIF